MKNLNEYPTPITNAAFDLCSETLEKCGDSPTLNGNALAFTADTMAGIALDLERKLALCRDALAECLSELQDDGRTSLSSDGVEQAIAALDLTK